MSDMLVPTGNGQDKEETTVLALFGLALAGVGLASLKKKTCPAGYTLQGDQCVPVQVGCPPGQVFLNGQCVTPKPAPGPSCPKQITVVSGNTLDQLAGANRLTPAELYYANRSTIEAAAHAHGFPSSYGPGRRAEGSGTPGWWIFPGEIWTVPCPGTTPIPSGGGGILGTQVVCPYPSWCGYLEGIAGRWWGAGNAGRWGLIYERNKSVIEAEARRHGLPSSDGGHWVYQGTRLAIPRLS